MADIEATDPRVVAERGLQLSGMDYIQAIFAGELPPPPISELMGFRGVSAEPGRAVFEMEPGPQHYNPIGSVHGGVALTLLDSAMGCAVHTLLEPGVGYTTLEVKTNFVRPIKADDGPHPLRGDRDPQGVARRDRRGEGHGRCREAPRARDDDLPDVSRGRIARASARTLLEAERDQRARRAHVLDHRPARRRPGRVARSAARIAPCCSTFSSSSREFSPRTIEVRSRGIVRCRSASVRCSLLVAGRVEHRLVEDVVRVRPVLDRVAGALSPPLRRCSWSSSIERRKRAAASWSRASCRSWIRSAASSAAKPSSSARTSYASRISRRRRPAHDCASVRHQLHDPVRLQLAQRLSHRRAADVELGGQHSPDGAARRSGSRRGAHGPAASPRCGRRARLRPAAAAPGEQIGSWIHLTANWIQTKVPREVVSNHDARKRPASEPRGESHESSRSAYCAAHLRDRRNPRARPQLSPAPTTRRRPPRRRFGRAARS